MIATNEKKNFGKNTGLSAPKGPSVKSRLVSLLDRAGMLLVFIVMFVCASFFVDGFSSAFNMKSLLLSVSMVGMGACTMLFCLASGDFDLSIEAVVAMSGVLAAMVVSASGNVLLGIAAGIAAGGVVGLLNGVIIAKLKINALITTLATMQIVKGIGYIISEGKAVGVSNEAFFVLGNARPLGVPLPVWITIACFIVFGFLLNRTIYGKNTLAIGGNAEAARLAGVAVDRVRIWIFLIQGLIAGFAGVILASRMTSGQPKTSEGFALEVISACVLGGVSLSGGVGTIMGVMVGVLIMGTMQNVMNLMNVEPFYQYVARGGVLLAAVIFDLYRQRVRKARL